MGDEAAQEEPLQLNLVSGDQGKKRKAREEEDTQHEQVQDQDQDDGKAPRRAKKPRRPAEGDGEGQQGQGRKDFVSSLFRHNPEIPRLEPSGAAPGAREAVFTERGFSESGLHPYLVKALSEAGLTRMTSVQARAIPAALGGKDALVKSQTGSGKTLAYALPILHDLQAIREPHPVTRADGVLALVVVPTRELALQSLEWLEKLCRSFARIVPGALLGGEKKKSEKARVRKGINILVSVSQLY